MAKLLIFMNIVFVSILAYQWNSFADKSEFEVPVVERKAIVEKEPVSVSEAGLPPLERFESVVQRPLFIQGRRPPPEEEEVVVEKPTPAPPAVRRPAVRLIAILIINQQRQAVFKSLVKKQALQRLGRGDEIDGWVVSDINPQQVTLKQGSAEEVFLLREYEKVSLPVVPVQKANQNSRGGKQGNLNQPVKKQTENK